MSCFLPDSEKQMDVEDEDVPELGESEESTNEGESEEGDESGEEDLEEPDDEELLADYMDMEHEMAVSVYLLGAEDREKMLR